MKDKILNIIHKKQTDEERYQDLKKSYKLHPEDFMNPDKWKELRLIELKGRGKIWSK